MEQEIDNLIATLDPAAPPEFDETAFNPLLEAATGGALKSRNELTELIPLREKYGQAESELRTLREQAAVSPYANDAIRVANEMVSQGKTLAEVRQFMELQETDFSTLSPEAAIKWQMRLDHPRLTSEQINALFEDQYPGVDMEAENAKALELTRGAKIAAASQKAIEGLQSRKVDISKPAQTNEAQQAAQAARKAGLEKLASAVIDRNTQIPISVKDEERKIDYSLPYNVKLDEATKKGIFDAVVSNHLANGAELNEQGLRSIRWQVDMLTKAMMFDDIIKAVVYDNYAHFTEKTHKEVANVQPVPKGSNNAPPPAQQRRPLIIKDARGNTYA